MRARQQAATGRKKGQDKALGRSRAGLSTKIHLLTDELGLPVDFAVTAGQVHDCTQAIALLGERNAEAVLADKGYDSDAIVEHIAAMGAAAVVPPKRNRKQPREYDKTLYKQRNRIERCFSRLKHFRRFATRYESSKSTSKPSSPSLAHGCTCSYRSIPPNALADTGTRYPFLAYGTDWLAFGHLVIAVAFIGPWLDPVRNKWFITFGLIACAAVIPLALIAGPIRGIPPYWRLIDCSFGVLGSIPLLICRAHIRQLELLNQSGADRSRLIAGAHRPVNPLPSSHVDDSL